MPMLFVCAKECVQCRFDFISDSIICEVCQYNIDKYTDAKQSALIRAFAQAEHASYLRVCGDEITARPHKPQKHTIRNSIIVSGMILGGVYLWHTCSSVEEREYVTSTVSAPMDTRPVERDVAKETRTTRNNEQAIIRKITEVCRRIKRDIKDISGDGEVNCQDYAAMFLRYYPEAPIMYHSSMLDYRDGIYKPHTFNRVRADTGWIYVEPQAVSGVWLMRDAWPGWKSTDPRNKEATEIWRR